MTIMASEMEADSQCCMENNASEGDKDADDYVDTMRLQEELVDHGTARPHLRLLAA